jgi:hypothetical protein
MAAMHVHLASGQATGTIAGFYRGEEQFRGNIPAELLSHSAVEKIQRQSG